MFELPCGPASGPPPAPSSHTGLWLSLLLLSLGGLCAAGLATRRRRGSRAR